MATSYIFSSTTFEVSTITLHATALAMSVFPSAKAMALSKSRSVTDADISSVVDSLQTEGDKREAPRRLEIDFLDQLKLNVLEGYQRLRSVVERHELTL